MARSRKGGRQAEAAGDALRLLARLIERAPAGVHVTGRTPAALDADLPAEVLDVLHAFGGTELFHGELRLLERPVAGDGGHRLQIAELGADTLWIDGRTGALWRLEEETGEWIEEGTSLSRWLLGWVEAEGELYDGEGEYKDDVIDEEGELTAEAMMRRERTILKRDPRAVGPRWRLARALLAGGDVQGGRAELEEVAGARPTFGWAWYQLARASEALGELDGACDEAVAAAEADPDYEHTPYFFAWAARLARLAGDEERRAELAGRALAGDDDLARNQLEAARTSAEQGDLDAAREQCEVVLALAPRDLAALDLLRTLNRGPGGS